MKKQYWENEVRPVVNEILSDSEKYKNDEQCFITAYQIVTLVNKEKSDIKREFPTGGEGAGTATLAQIIAWYLSNDDYFNDRIERRFLSTKGLDEFIFNGGNVPSTEEFSMFRFKY